MRVGYFKKQTSSGFHVSADFVSNCFYVPDEQVVIYQNRDMFRAYSFLGKQGDLLLEQAKALAEGRVLPTEPQGRGTVVFSEISWFDYDTDKIRGLIKTASGISELEAKLSPLKEEFSKGIDCLSDTAEKGG